MSLTSWGQENAKDHYRIRTPLDPEEGRIQQSMLLLIQSPTPIVLGITVVTGDQWLHAEVAHTVRMLELIGRPTSPSLLGAEYPLVRRQQETEQWEQRYGSVHGWLRPGPPLFIIRSDQLGEMPEGRPTNSARRRGLPLTFCVRMVHKFPNQIYEL